MATAVLTSTPTIIRNADTTTGWTGALDTLDPDIKVQGTNGISGAMTVNGNNDCGATLQTAADLSSVHLRLWFNATFVSYWSATNPVQVYITDGTNTAYYAWTGGTSYSGGWAQIVIDTAATPTSGTKPTGNSTEVGIRIVTSSKPRNVPANIWADYWTYGDGYTVTGGTSGDPITWADIAAADTFFTGTASTDTAYNIVAVEKNGSISVRGDIQIGDGTSTTYFEPSGEIVIFPDEQVATTLYGITFVDSASNLTNVAISGGSISSQSPTYRFTFDASDTNINSFTKSGIQMANGGAISYSSVTSVTTTVYDNCGQVDPSTGTFTDNIIRNYVGTPGALLWPSDDSNINNITFLLCDNDVEYASTSDSTPNFVNIVHDDNAGDYDVNNTSGASVTIPLSGTSNGNSYNPGGSIVTFQASVTLTFLVTNEAGTPLQGARINVVRSDTKVELYQLETNASGIATQAHTYAGDLGIEGWVREFNLSGNDHVPKEFAGTITSAGFNNETKLAILT